MRPVLIIGGGIANFTDVASTFAGIINVLTQYKTELRECKCIIRVRRGGPNYQMGLKLMRECGEKCALDMKVFGPETHITAIVSMALLNKDANESKTELSMADINMEEAINAKFDKQTFHWNKASEKQKVSESLNSIQ